MGVGAEHEGVQVLWRELCFVSDARDAGATFGGKHVIEDAGAFVLQCAAGLVGAETARGEGGQVELIFPLAELAVVVRGAKHGHG